MAKKKAHPVCFTCASDAHYEGLYGEHTPRGLWTRVRLCYYCKTVVDQVTLGSMMWTRLFNQETQREADSATAFVKDLLKKARKKKPRK